MTSRRPGGGATPCAAASTRSRRTACPRPVLDSARRPVAVVSVWGPADRVTPARFEALGALVREAALSLTNA